MSDVDAVWVEATLLELARVDTTVPAGRTEVEEGDLTGVELVSVEEVLKASRVYAVR